MRWSLVTLTLIAGLVIASGCLPDDGPVGLRATPAGAGPKVVFNLDERPLPDIPFPNDLLARADLSSPTGLRLNLPLRASTRVEERMRERARALDGFGLYGPITVRFDHPLDLGALDGRGRPYEDDPILLLDITEPSPEQGGSEHFGERTPLDLGRGSFPLALPALGAFFPHDPRAQAGNLLFETVDEDLDQSGDLSGVEDTDGDGVLDRPNLFRAGGHEVDDLVTFYESETDTLWLRPLVPLRPGRRYAVVITEGVRGRDGRPVRSPFPFVHHTQQMEALALLPDALARHGVGIDQVAFAWAFTTQTATTTLVDLRRGIAGVGPFAELAQRFPPEVSRIEIVKAPGADERVLLRTEQLQEVIALLGCAGSMGCEGAPLEHLVQTFEAVDYLVAARFVTPYLLGDDDGQVPQQGGYPADEDETIRIDPESGSVVVGGQEVPFWCTLPKATEAARAPFPVVLFAHDLGATRLQALPLAGNLARWGFATCALDAPGHGWPAGIAGNEVLTAQLEALKLGPFASVLGGSRARDLDNDGVPDPGGDMLTADLFHSRDMVRQTALDWMQMIAVLRGFDGRRRWAYAGGVGVLAGDFDADGVPDLGGPDAALHLTGVGLGGSVAAMVGGLEPYLRSVAPISAAAGLSDVALRSTAAGLNEAVALRLMGPLVLGDPAESGFTQVRFFVSDVTRAQSLPFAYLPPLVPGDRVVLRNERSGEQSEALVNSQGAFRVAVAADALGATEVRVLAGLRPWRDDFSPVRLCEHAGRVTEACEAPAVTELGDPLILEVYDSTGEPRYQVAAFERDVTFQGVIYPEGEPLVAVAPGWGIRRQSPRLRRFVQIMQSILDPADAVVYARHIFKEPLRLEGVGETGARLLVLVTAGDSVFPVATGLALARAAGVLPWGGEVPGQEGRSALEVLGRLGVVEGVARLRRFGDSLFDVDNLSEGADGFGAQRLVPPLRYTVDCGGTDCGLRVALLDPKGAHGIGWPRPDRPWDGPTYLANLLGQFFRDGDLTHRGCLASGDCPDMPPAP